VAINPEYPIAHYTLAHALAMQGDYSGAAYHYAEACRISPGFAPAHTRLGMALVRLGRIRQGIAQFLTALSLDPRDAKAHYNLALALEREGKTDEAMPHCYEAAILTSDSASLRVEYAQILNRRGEAGAAIRQYRMALKLEPRNAEALGGLAWLLATGADARLRNGAEAIRLAGQSCALTGFKQADPIGTLAAACAEAGRFDEAVRIQENLLAAAREAAQADWVAESQRRLDLYKANTPLRDANPSGKGSIPGDRHDRLPHQRPTP
jgi:tetratricopeptide (TPR) repeat protein